MSLRPLMPFMALNPKQLDEEWLNRGYGVEAIFFDGAQLEDLSKVGKFISGLECTRTIHFPMNNADWLHDRHAWRGLLQTIDVAIDAGVEGVILHSNYFVDTATLRTRDLAPVRAEYLSALAQLDERLIGSNLWLGVENMPLLGDDGTDSDPIFVFPGDFQEFDFSHVGRVLDTAHWAGAVDTADAPGSSFLLASGLPHRRSWAGMLEAPGTLVHVHFSAVQGLVSATPGSIARGGGVPEDAPNSGRYAELIRPLHVSELTISLEIEETDYMHRKQLWRALDWLNGLCSA